MSNGLDDAVRSSSRDGKLLRRIRGLPRGPRQLERSLALLASMRDLGWQDSVRAKRPIDDMERPVAWWTYPAIAWFEPRLQANHRAFEWGSGNSTLWLAGRVKEVVSVEDSPDWAREVSGMAPSNVTVLIRSSGGEDHSTAENVSDYVRAIEGFPDAHFDVVVVDGRDRNACADLAPRYLKDDGLIVFDNSDRPGSRPGLEQLDRRGFLRIDFVGFAPGNHYLSCTSVLSRAPEKWLRDPLPAWMGY